MVHTRSGMLFNHKKDKILSFPTQMGLKTIMLSDIMQAQDLVPVWKSNNLTS
jgi:hypothetical protein